ncbi:MAG: FAD binding domain-containing protein [Gemmatimonadota bacterium]|nr:FAD binding domain-containing protein [Gemmatimonadota bacterium]
MLRLPPHQYHRPETVEEALQLLATHGEDAMIISGGTDLLPNMKHGLFEPAHLVSLRHLKTLQTIRLEGGELRIGAGVTLAAVSRDPLVVEHAPSLALASGLVAGPQLRNMGTLGGNVCLDTRCTYYNQSRFWRKALGYCLKKDGTVCHVTKVGKKCVAAHSADTPPVLMTLGARLLLQGSEGTEEIPVDEFFVSDGIWNTRRRRDQILTEIRIPILDGIRRSAYRKLRQRNAIDFPLLSVAVSADLADDGRVSAIRGVVSGLGARPKVLTGWEDIAAGNPLDQGVVAALAERAESQCRPLENIIVDPEWRRAMVPVYVERALQDLVRN